MFGRPSGCIDQLTTVERAAIVTLHGIGWTGRRIAEELHCDEHAVTRWVHRWQDPLVGGRRPKWPTALHH